jgi:hypothetical protein
MNTSGINIKSTILVENAWANFGYEIILAPRPALINFRKVLLSKDVLGISLVRFY